MAGEEEPKEQIFSSVQTLNADLQKHPVIYPSLVPGLISLHNQEEADHGPGIYAIPVSPFMGEMAVLPCNNLISLSYKIPTRPNPSGTVSENGQEAQQQHGPQRQVVVRRFHFQFQIDLGLIIKLAAVIFLFNDGSRQRLLLLLFFASLVYLYQTGALAPALRWLRQHGTPPRPQPPVRRENGPPIEHDDVNAHQPEGNPGPANQDQPTENTERPVENENQPEHNRRNGFDWWGIAREIKMVVVGFVTSLVPGLDHHND